MLLTSRVDVQQFRIYAPDGFGHRLVGIVSREAGYRPALGDRARDLVGRGGELPFSGPIRAVRGQDGESFRLAKNRCTREGRDV